MRTCAFCGREANSREDAWPKWLVDSIAKNRSSQIEALFGPDVPDVTWGGRYVKVKRVCKTHCNNGWMSVLEDSTQPFLEPMVHDVNAQVLDLSAQAFLAQWSVKTVMALELARPGNDWFYSDADRKHLFTWRVPPPDTTIWIGRYVNSHSLFAQSHKLAKPKSESLLREGYSTVLVMGRVVIQVASVRVKGAAHAHSHLTPAITKDLPWESLLFRLWPMDSVIRWPPLLHFTDSGHRIDTLLRRFGPND